MIRASTWSTRLLFTNGIFCYVTNSLYLRNTLICKFYNFIILVNSCIVFESHNLIFLFKFLIFSD